jgi:hypothetical protein
MSGAGLVSSQADRSEAGTKTVIGNPGEWVPIPLFSIRRGLIRSEIPIVSGDTKRIDFLDFSQKIKGEIAKKATWFGGGLFEIDYPGCALKDRCGGLSTFNQA